MGSFMASESNTRKYLPTSTDCFVCGEDNHAGLQLRFYVDDDVVKTDLDVQPHHCGYDGVVHGGITAAALDECMCWAAARATGRTCVTGELTVRYIKRVPHDRRLTACAEVVKASRRIVHATSVLVDEDGTEYARASGRFVPLSVEETIAVDDGLIYRGGEERVFDKTRAELQKA